MKSDIAQEKHVELREVIEQYEKACETEDQVDLRLYLPDSRHPDFELILRELICTEMDHRWRKGCPRSLDEYQQEHPELFADLAHLKEILFEDYRQRQQAGREIQEDDYKRFGLNPESWLEYPQTVARPPGAPSSGEPLSFSQMISAGEIPVVPESSRDTRARSIEVGMCFQGFDLLEELGRGAFSRVFLARQRDLAQRPVVLKVSTERFGESQLLAQLQHTNIVPIYSIHRSGLFHGICMPYFGATTLADVLREIKSSESRPRTGRALLSTKNNHSTWKSDDSRASTGKESIEVEVEQNERHNEVFENLTYEQAVIWIGERLADGLAHAHHHGILHRDIKPANVLLTDEGEPMLLDFNLSEQVQDHEKTTASVGGTFPYMAPEQIRAFLGNKSRVDEKSDLYSLGLILFELATGQRAFATPEGSKDSTVEQMLSQRESQHPDPLKIVPGLSPALASIIRQCLAPRPEDRYQCAHQLREDLQRQYEDRPLKYAREGSTIERLAKWGRRHPRMAMTMASLFAIVLCIALTLRLIHEGHQRTKEANQRMHLQAQQSWKEFQKRLPEIQFLMNDDRAGETKRYREALGLAERSLQGFGGLSDSILRSDAFQRLSSAQQIQLREDVGEIYFLMARASLLQSEKENVERSRFLKQAQKYNADAEKFFGRERLPKAIWLQRAEIASLQGQQQRAKSLRAQAESIKVQRKRDYYLLARRLANEGLQAKAIALLDQAVEKDPQNFWAWFLKGSYHAQLRQEGLALKCYEVCIALQPTLYAPYLERGVSYLRQQNQSKAKSSFDKVIQLRPGSAEAYANRGLVWHQQGEYEKAIEDFTSAIRLSSRESRLYFLRARSRRSNRDEAGAQKDELAGLQQRPEDELSWIARGLARQASDPKAALKDYQKALEINPRSLVALQNLAALYSERLNDDEESLKQLNRLLKINPHYLPARRGRSVLLARMGQRDQALADAKKSLDLTRWQADPHQEGRTWYYLACTYSLTSQKKPEDRKQALQALANALRKGFGHQYIEKDTDLAPLRKEAEFQRLVNAALALRKKEKQKNE